MGFARADADGWDGCGCSQHWELFVGLQVKGVLGCGDDAVKDVGNGGWGHRVVKYHYLVDGRPDEEASPAVWGGCR